MHRRPKKFHGNGLPHLGDASSATEIVAGAQLWSQQLMNGNYTFLVAEEHAIDDSTDLLVVVRKKVNA